MAKNEITLRDVYDIVDRLERKMDERLMKLEDKTDKLENNQSRALGVLSVFTVFIGAASAYVWDRIMGR